MLEAFAWSAWWAPGLGWTVVTLAVSWLAGYLIGATLAGRVLPALPGSHRPVIDRTAWALRRRLPLWTLLFGGWLSLGHWPLTRLAHDTAANGIVAALALSVTLAVASVASAAVSVYGARLTPGLPVSSLTRNVVWGLVTAIGLLVVLNGLGVAITPMLTALGVGGLAVALALQESLANFFAGVFLAIAGQIRVGDYVRLDAGQEGYVADFGWRSTRLRMLANNLVVVPNSKFAQAVVVNHDLPSPDLAVLVDLGVDYASDLAQVERVVMEVGGDVMATVEGGVRDFQPFVRFHTFGESSIDFTAILRAQHFVDQYLVKHEFIKRLHRRFEQEGIVIPFPIRTLVQRDVRP